MRNIAVCRSPISVLLLATLVGRAVADDQVEFRRDVLPILQDHCLKCHGPEKQEGGLRFDALDTAIGKGESGEQSIVPGNADESALLRRITSSDESERMPPEGEPLTAEQINIVRRWIDQGAPWPADAAGHRPAAVRTQATVTDKDRQHWSFRPLSSVELPPVAETAAVCSPIDRFVVAALESAGVEPNPPADDRTLVRRLYFDVVGLPPSPAEVDAFLVAASRDRKSAMANVVDQLLASPHYGERWGRHWLDVARYADSNGWESDDDRPFAYHYRDFVIKALNQDLPFDTFVRWQLAGDEFEPDNPLAVAATGFLAAGPNTVLNVPMEEEKLRNRYNELDDLVTTVGAGLLGLTVGCARCHDHKFDAIPSRDYYQMLSAFHSGDRAEVLLGSRHEISDFRQRHSDWQKRLEAAKSKLDEWLDDHRKPLESKLRLSKIDQLPVSDSEKQVLKDDFDSDAGQRLGKKFEGELRVGDDEIRSLMDDNERQTWRDLESALADVRQAEPSSPPKALVYRDYDGTRRDTWLFKRADFYDRTQPVGLGFLTLLTSTKTAVDYWNQSRETGSREDTTFQRKALALWITDVDRGAGALLARVIVNRIWQQHFGEGLVRTPSDFGVRGDAPTHPKLIEWLANDLVQNGWKLKRLHRMILNSAVYSRHAKINPAAASMDPDNRLLWRHRPKRLEAEILRDTMLFVSGTLNPKPYGPAFKPPIAAEAMLARNLTDPYPRDIDETPDTLRRSVYMFHKRVVPYPLLQVFDRPELLQSCGRRDTTTVAPQALALLNDRFVRDRSIDFARRLLRERHDPAERISRAYELAFNRLPDEVELQEGVRFVETQTSNRLSRANNVDDPKASPDQAELLALADYCQVVYALNEFFFID
jgi:hypothetical protein